MDKEDHMTHEPFPAEIIAVQQFNGKLLVFSRHGVYHLKPVKPVSRWHRWWHSLLGLNKTAALMYIPLRVSPQKEEGDRQK